MTQEIETLVGRVSAVVFSGNDGYRVFKLAGVTRDGQPAKDAVVVGTAPSVSRGQRLQVTGSWQERKSKRGIETQFAATAVLAAGRAPGVEESPERAAARAMVPAVVAAVQSACEQTGGTAVAMPRLLATATANGGATSDAMTALEIAAEDGHVRIVERDGRKSALSKGDDEAETKVARALAGRAARTPPWDVAAALAGVTDVEATMGFSPSPSQVDAIRMMLGSTVSVLTGGPGTGKTTIVRTFVETVSDLGMRVGLCAPVGRAARRLSEQTGRKAHTVHKLLGVKRNGDFVHGPRDRLPFDVVVVDEGSMLDLSLTAALCDALEPGAALVVVGDVDQLPSIGRGQVMHDVIESGAVAVARLTEVHRQGGGSLAVINGERMLRGEMPYLTAAEAAVEHGAVVEDWTFVEVDTSFEAQRVVLDLACGGLAAEGHAPEDVAVMTPQRSGTVGLDELNAGIRARLNPPRPGVDERDGWRVGDRVMATRNDYDREVINGEPGVVVGVTARTVTIAYDEATHEYTGNVDGLVARAWAMTVHKAQGSEWAVAILPVTSEHAYMLRKYLMRTAQSRGRKRVILVGQLGALRRAVTTVEERRPTDLEAKLRDASAQRSKGPSA